MPKKKRKTGTSMISVDGEYIKECIKSRNGIMDRISEDMGYNETYLSFNLSRNQQHLLPVVLDYLVLNWGVDKARAMKTPAKTDESIDLKALSDKIDTLTKKVEVLHRSFYEVQKVVLELNDLWK